MSPRNGMRSASASLQQDEDVLCQMAWRST